MSRKRHRAGSLVPTDPETTSPEGEQVAVPLAGPPAGPPAVPQADTSLAATGAPRAKPGEQLAALKGELVKGGTVRPEGRRTYSQWDKEELLSLVCCGVSVASATAAVGCSRRTFYRWLAEDPVFRKRFHNDRGLAQTDPLEMLREHAKHNWRAAQYLHKHSIRRERRLAKDRLEPSEKWLGQVEIALVNMFNDLAPVLQQVDDELRKSFDQVLAGHLDILNNVMNGLWRADEEEIVKRDPIWSTDPLTSPTAPAPHAPEQETLASGSSHSDTSHSGTLARGTSHSGTSGSGTAATQALENKGV